MRDNRIDNAKGILIFLVVLGHFLESFQGWESPLVSAVLTSIYMFHMPAFVFLAGITAKRDKVGARIANLAIILVLFQLAYVLPVTLKSGAYPVGALQPFWMLWFLLSMIWWIALLPLILRLPYPLLISVAIAGAAGLVPWIGYPLSASRTLVFLPFFVAGHLYGQRVMASLPVSPLAVIPAVLALVALAVPLYMGGIGHPWLSGYMGYELLGADGAYGVLIRGGLLLVASLATYAVLVATPTKAGWLSVIGGASMAVFLLHGFCVMIGGKVLRLLQDGYGVSVSLIAAVAASILVTWLLGRPSLDRLIRGIPAMVMQRFAQVRQQVRS